MSRVQLAMRVSDLEGSVAFYRSLFGVEPARRRPGYANFAITEPPLKLVLIEGVPDQPTVMDHLGVEVQDAAEVDSATARLSERPTLHRRSAARAGLPSPCRAALLDRQHRDQQSHGRVEPPDAEQGVG